MSFGQKLLKMKSDPVNSTIGVARPILASSIPKVGLQVIKPLIVSKPRVEALEASAVTAKESCVSPKSCATQDKITPAAAKLGRWTPQEKNKFVEGKYSNR